MDVTLDEQIFLSYKRLPYKAWYAIAEFVDNSTQAYFNHKTLLDRIYNKESKKLTVTIENGQNFIRISDNSIGMSETDLQRALAVGRPPRVVGGRSRYGLGLKTGACWLGEFWTVTTKRFGHSYGYKISFSVPRVAAGDRDLRMEKRRVDKKDHYTIIEIRGLHTPLPGRSLGRIKNYLRSIYRIDLRTGILTLKWGEEELKWDQKKQVDDRLRKNRDGSVCKRKFRFKLGKDKTITGWAGVLDPGTRQDAGFSVIQADRVIQGWPGSWRPAMIFGEQEGGRNDLINQRLTGEIYLDGFDVSHTKDEILFDHGEEERLEKILKRKIADLIKLAREYRAESAASKISGKQSSALNRFEKEIKSDKVRDFIENYDLPNVSTWVKSNSALLKAVTKTNKPEVKAKIGKLDISLYYARDMSPNDPYVIYESTTSKDSVIIVLNLRHPYWRELTKEESILNFVRHCTYDGVAEWKSFFTIGRIEPDTVKLIKDKLLRTTFEVAD